jgi:hypothetical protein
MIFKKKLSALLGSVVLMSVLAACGETEVEGVPNADAEKEKPAELEKTEIPDEVFKVGDTVSVNGLEITIKSAAFAEPTEYSPSVNGKIITLDVAVKNTNKEQAFIDNTEFAIYDNEGNKMEDYYGFDEMALSDDVNSGKQLQGKLYFDVKEQPTYEMIYTPSFTMDSKEIKFEIAVQ